MHNLHGTHHRKQDYGTILLQVSLHSFALESSCQPIGGQEQGSREEQQGHRPIAAIHSKGFDERVEKRMDFEAKVPKEINGKIQWHSKPSCAVPLRFCAFNHLGEPPQCFQVLDFIQTILNTHYIY